MLTLREIDRRLYAYYERLRRQNRHDLVIAWQTANLVKAKRLPSIEVFLNPVARIPTGEEKKKLQRDHDQLVKEMG